MHGSEHHRRGRAGQGGGDMTFRHRASTQSPYSRRTNMGSPQLCHRVSPSTLDCSRDPQCPLPAGFGPLPTLHRHRSTCVACVEHKRPGRLVTCTSEFILVTMSRIFTGNRIPDLPSSPALAGLTSRSRLRGRQCWSVLLDIAPCTPHCGECLQTRCLQNHDDISVI